MADSDWRIPNPGKGRGRASWRGASESERDTQSLGRGRGRGLGRDEQFQGGAGDATSGRGEQRPDRGRNVGQGLGGNGQSQGGNFGNERREPSRPFFGSTGGNDGVGSSDMRFPVVKHLDISSFPDPYKMDFNKDLHSMGWIQPDSKDRDDFQVQKSQRKPLGWKKYETPVAVNHFQLFSRKGVRKFSIPLSFYQYDIEMEIMRAKANKPHTNGSSKKQQGRRPPDEQRPKKELPKTLSQLILQSLIPRLCKEYGFYGIVTDNKKLLYSTRKLEDVFNNELSHEIMLREVKYWDEDDVDGIVKVRFTYASHIDTTSIAEYYENGNNLSLEGCRIDSTSKQTIEAALNALVRSFPKFRYVSVRRYSLVPWQEGGGSAGHALGGGLVAWKGIAVNIAMGWKPYMNVDLANCAFWIGENALKVLDQIFESNRCRASSTDVSRWNEIALRAARYLNTCKIRYTTSPGKFFGGTVRNVLPESVSEKKFEMDRNGGKVCISVYRYFTECKGVALQYPRGPLLQLGESKFIPAEICTIKKGQSYNRRELMGDMQTSNMLKYAQRKPHELKAEIEGQIANLCLEKNEVLQELGINIPNKMLTLNARVLAPPDIRYGQKGGKVGVVTANQKGHWEAFGNNLTFYEPAKIGKWGVLRLDGGGADSKLKAFCDKLRKISREIGIECTSEEPVVRVEKDIIRDCRSSPVDIVSKLEKYFKKDFTGSTLVIVVIQKNSSLYGLVKHAAEVRAGLLTQCVIPRSVYDERAKGPSNSTIQNIVLKLNSKAGGVNHVPVPPLDKSLASKFCKVLMECPVLVMGADVTHPGLKFTGKENEFAPSYAAVTGSIDRTCMPYMTELRAQLRAAKGAAEVIQDMKRITCNFLETFSRVSGTLPWKIVYIRDGVGEGQFRELLHKEMVPIREACKEVGGDKYQPQITFVTAQKRHKTRIFNMKNGRVDQAPPGTVIDTEIVHTSETDFYLLSHHGLQGTSRPTRYHVLWDDSKFFPDEIQSMIYTLCYAYCRCTKSVSLPAPTYYAHRAADRAKKLCEGFEDLFDDPTTGLSQLNQWLVQVAQNMKTHPLHFV